MKRRLIFSVFATFLFANVCFAQSLSLIEYLPDKSGELTTSCLDRLNHWNGIASNESLHFVFTMDIAVAQEEGRLKFNLPEISEDIYATAVSVKENEDSTLVWYGTIDCYEGDMMLVSKDSVTIGYINYKERTFSIRKLCSGYVVLIEHLEENPEHECATPEGLGMKGPEPPQVCCLSTILVLYTDAAEQAGDPESEAVLLVENTKQALINSQVCHMVKLVGVEKIGFTETGNAFADRVSIKDDPEAKALRNQYGADIVMLLTDGVYGGIMGISWLDQFGNQEFGYTITAITSPPGRHTFAHEWAHDLGARHDTDGTPGFAHAHNFGTGRTLLASLGSTGHRELHYSNPDVDFNGVATGIADERDNARQLDDLGCTIANYRTGNHYCEDFTVFIDGPVIVEAGNTYEWCVNASDCGSNLTLSWEYSFDGFNWYSGGYDDCMSLTAGTKHIHLRVKAICDNGCFNIGYLFAINSNGLFSENCIELRSSGQSKNIIGERDLMVYPNPSTESIKVDFEPENMDGEVYSVSIFNSFGNSLFMGDYSTDDLKNKRFDISGFHDGIYFITLSNGDSYVHRKFIVQH